MMNKKSLIIISFAFIFLLSMSIVFSVNDSNQNEKISFGEWLKGLWGKITGKQIQQQLVCTDGDRDGYGVGDCFSALDCNDNNANVNPGATEVCDGVDNDCDGITDEGCPATCTNGATTNHGCSQVGFCSGAFKTCSSGTWGACSKTPQPEICGNNIDEDCNGLTDEGCQVPICVNGATRHCGTTNVGACEYGTQTCSSGSWGNCVGQVTPIIEIPDDGIDQDCNGADLLSVVCISNFTISSQTCLSSEVLEINWTDVNACGLNYTEKSSCDYNKNNLVCESFPGIENVGIGGYLLNVSRNYTNAGINLVELAQPGGGGADFDWNFADPLDFCNISIEVADSDSDNFGYTIVKNVGVSNKTVWVERLNNSNKICVKDIPGIASISEFSNNCNEDDEVLVSCPSGVNSTYKCEIVKDTPPSKLSWFKVWPLNHSAVKELTFLASAGAVSGGCSENWNCTEFSDAVNQCGTRICNDLSNCTTVFDKPLEIKSCIPGDDCVPDWTCTGYGKCVNGFKERICTDLNDCEIDTTKPSETQECKGKSPFLIIILAIVGLILIIFLILYFMKRKKSGEEYSDETPIHATHQSPPRPPANVYTPRPQYAQQGIQR